MEVADPPNFGILSQHRDNLNFHCHENLISYIMRHSLLNHRRNEDISEKLK
jgi:hypothetical protein